MAKKKTKQNKDTQELSNSAKETEKFCWYEGDILVLNVLGTPSAKRDLILKPKANQLKISVTAAPDDGKATDYMVKFLSREFGVSKSDIEVVFGRTSINKQLRIKDPKILPAVIKKELS